ncbi:IclR family transcriptional regulator [Haloarchaeobius sp. HRN-SO-5]|uniref:IclR family transcriptional regulator n=1 Tax=Haloarchaeobius sp. HRN-SO-5 TaxID=3446118 RepID=UPI003EB738EC
MSSDRRRIRAVETTSKILAELKETGETTVATLDARLDVTKGTIHTHLMTLNAQGFVEKRDDRYRLGSGFMTYGAHVKNRHVVFQAGKAQAKELALETGELCEIATEHEGRCVILHRFYGENTLDTGYQRESLEEFRHLHYGATGKSMLAHMPLERVDQVIEEYGLPKRTEKTITDRETLLDELERIRGRGYAFNDEEEVHGIRAVGAPVLNSNRDLLGAICLAGPRGRVDDERFSTEFPALVSEARSLVEVNVETNEFDTFSV